MLTVTDLIAEGLALAAVEGAPVPCPDGTVDAITGAPIVEGYVAHALAGSNTTEFLDTFRGNQAGYVSVNTARCWRAQNPRGDNRASRSILAFADGTAWLPMIARETATDERPCWSDLVRRVAADRMGQPCVVIVTTDQKKRLWPRARVGQLGPATPVYVYDSGQGLEGVLFVAWAELVALLDLIEPVYTAGFVKPQIGGSLLTALAKPPVPLAQIVAWERDLRRVRTLSAFPLALLLAQRRGEPPPPPTPAPATPAQRARREPKQGVLL